MIKKNQRMLNWVNRVSDAVLVYIAYVAAVWIWIDLLAHDSRNVATDFAFERPLLVAVILFAMVVLFQYGRLYDSFRAVRFGREAATLAVYFGLFASFCIGLLFLVGQRYFSRGVMGLFTLLGYASLLAKRYAMREFLRRMRKKGYNQRHIMVVGEGQLAEKYITAVKENPEYGFICDGHVGKWENPEIGSYLGGFDVFPELLETVNPDEVVIALETYEQGLINKIIFSCEAQGIKASIIPIYSDFLPASASIDTVGQVRMINVRSAPLDMWLNKFMKRAFDICFSLLVIILLSPVYLALAIGVRLSGPGPILFRQTRVGYNRKEFAMLKFRSMRVNNESDTAWSKKTDSRITPFGAFIRKCSLDELPQFFNVLNGTMSVIGPRPELPHFVNEYKKTVPLYMVKHQVKPGITGWAQVNGLRGDTSIEERIKYDVWYIENWSLFLDIRIVFMTVFGGMMNEEQNINRMREKRKNNPSKKM